MQEVINRSNGGLSSDLLMSRMAPPHPSANSSAFPIDHPSMLSLTVPYSLPFLRTIITPQASESSLTWDGVTPPAPIQTLLIISLIPYMQCFELHLDSRNRSIKDSTKFITKPRLWTVGEGANSSRRILSTIAFMTPEELNVHMFLPNDGAANPINTATFYWTQAPQLLELNLIDSWAYTQRAVLGSFQTESLQRLEIGLETDIRPPFAAIDMMDSDLRSALRDFVRVYIV